MQGKSRAQVNFECEKLIEYNEGLAMGLWVLKQCQGLTPQGIKFMTKAMEDMIIENEIKYKLMLKRTNNVKELATSKKAA